MKHTHLYATVAMCGALFSHSVAVAQDHADRIWHGGSILTMEDDAMRAEAIAEKDGVIIAVGDDSDVMAYQGAGTKVIDLAGKTMLPGFVDAHGHVFNTGFQALSANLLAPPDGEVQTIPAMQETLKLWIKENPEIIETAKLIVGFGYDDAQLTELRHPVRQELDEISRDVPVYVIHQSGHLGVGNTKALDVAGITPKSPKPDGGVIRREEDGKTPNGVLEESIHFQTLLKLLENVWPEASKTVFKAGVNLYSRFGYTTAQEGRATVGVAKTMKAVADLGDLKLDVVPYIDFTGRDYALANVSKDYVNHYRVAGMKLTIDGSPQGFTAWRDRPYYAPPEHLAADYSGYPAETRDTVFDQVDFAFSNNIQILTHANGEAASDLLIAAIKTATSKYGPADRRPVLIHGQFMREDQVDALQALNIFPSLFPMHTFYWGDWHRDRTVGPINAENISPTGWVRKRGMMFSSHHDAPVAFPNSMRVLDATVTRRSRSGDIIGPSQRVDVITGLKGMTIWPAYQHFEEDKKGSLKIGKLADFVILSDDPTAIDPEAIAEIKVLETIKEGESVFLLE